MGLNFGDSIPLRLRTIGRSSAVTGGTGATGKMYLVHMYYTNGTGEADQPPVGSVVSNEYGTLPIHAVICMMHDLTPAILKSC